MSCERYVYWGVGSKASKHQENDRSVQIAHMRLIEQIYGLMVLKAMTNPKRTALPETPQGMA